MSKTPVKERLMQTAEKLFYEQGYRATGINQIIKEAEVAKASFYQYFPSKEALCVAYLEDKHITANQRQKQFITTGENPVERICNLFENIRQNAIANDFNGCHFLNIASEINEHENAIRLVVTKHKSRLLDLIKNELSEYQNNEMLAEMLYVIYEGANISVKNYRDFWPIDRGISITQKLLSEAKND
ncbi:MAG: TetR family transcriptional regulator [Denitrovibrio sp.]|nr:MAG: TetR family transcriptional regulator [Denitrovibrio sp.]